MGPEIGRRFESLVADLFRQWGFSVEERKRFGQTEADIFASSPSRGITAIVEAKLYRYRRVATQTIKNVAILVDSLRREAGADKAVLVTTARLNPLAQAELRSIPNFVVYDFDRLIALVAEYPELATMFDSIIREADAFGRGGDDGVKQLPPEERRPYELDTIPTEWGESALQPETRGQSLCDNLDQLVGAQSTASKEKKLELAREFQRTCIDALKYLFDEDLTAWQDQLTTEAKISRFDLVARIRPNGGFWGLFSSDFGTRYIVFEFKFYTKKISQGQILTTEKYLYRAALRSAAIIISPQGANKTALQTARGALREHGKLIINLTAAQLCNMLRAKDGAVGPDDNSADVEQELFDTVDNMLMRIER